MKEKKNFISIILHFVFFKMDSKLHKIQTTQKPKPLLNPTIILTSFLLEIILILNLWRKFYETWLILDPREALLEGYVISLKAETGTVTMICG